MNIEITLNDLEFEQDIRALAMAFYPGSVISVGQAKAPDQGEEDPAEPEAGQTNLRRLEVLRQKDHIRIRLFRQDRLFLEDRFAESGQHGGTDQTQNRLERKNRLKRHLYRVFSEDTDKTLPWGTLTGIRPTKLPMAMLEKGMSPGEIEEIMSREYNTGKEKIALATEIAQRERQILRRIDYEKGYSLYVGIPFCPSTCAYCSFPSNPLSRWKTKVDDYLDALEKELAWVSGCCREKTMDTLYIGGGTPTTLEPAQLERLFSMLERYFSLDQLLEWSVEAGRPDSITREKLQVLKDHPVTRISINPQTMKEETLKLIGRHHTVAQTEEAFFLARSMGFDNINMDLILGLPDETPEDVADTMSRIAVLAPDSLTVHSLAIKRAARLNTEKESFQNRRMVNTEDLHSLTEQKARNMGLLPYYLYRQKNMAGNLENVGYAREGKFGIYNILIMEEMQSIFAVGAGGSSKLVFPGGRHERVENVKDVGQYMSRIDEMIQRKRAALENLGRPERR